jgi:GntR family phosphonate transport system transcriptional regulator
LASAQILTGADADMSLAFDTHTGTSDPRWRGVFCAIRRDIDQQRLMAGEKLPPERQLAELHGVSRHTIRIALSALEAEGLVEIIHGRGLFVAEQIIPMALGARTRFSDNMSRLHLDGRREHLADRVEFASLDTCRALELDEGAEVVVVEMLSLVENRPIALVRDFYALPRFQGIAEKVRETGSASAALAAYGVRDYLRKSSRIASRPPSAYEAKHLGMRRNQTLLVTHKLEVDAEGRPVTYGESCFRGDRVNLVVDSTG